MAQQQPPPYYAAQGQPPAVHPGAYPSAPGPYPQSYPQGQPVVGQPVQQPNTTVVVMGPTCGQCGRGPITEEFTACGIILAICFFPLGILCCLLMKEKKCTSCGASF